MKRDSRIIISLDKQFYSDDDEIRIHVWFNHAFYSVATLTVLSPTGITIDTAPLKTAAYTTETFALTCGGPLMFENGYYWIRVECDNAVSEAMFEYYNSKNRFKRGFGK
jgi:hypothetical protein